VVVGNDVENRNRKSSILILDDDFDIVTVIKLGLQKYRSFDVYAFTDPALALEHFKVNASKSTVRLTFMHLQTQLWHWNILR